MKRYRLARDGFLLRSLEHMSEFNPEGALLIQKTIWDNYAMAAEVPLSRLMEAYNRVVSNGFYGPFRDEEYNECHDTDITMKEAHDILRKAIQGYIPSEFTYIHPDCGWECEGSQTCEHGDHVELGDDGPIFHYEDIKIDYREIRKDCFWGLILIYGEIPY